MGRASDKKAALASAFLLQDFGINVRRAPLLPVKDIPQVTLRKSVNLIAVSEDREVLLLKRHDAEDIEPGKWSLPGGSVEAGETIEEALYREVFEETGCAVATHKKVLERVFEGTVETHYYLGTVRGEVRINDESSDFGWFEINALGNLEIAFEQSGIIARAIASLETVLDHS